MYIINSDQTKLNKNIYNHIIHTFVARIERMAEQKNNVDDEKLPEHLSGPHSHIRIKNANKRIEELRLDAAREDFANFQYLIRSIEIEKNKELYRQV